MYERDAIASAPCAGWSASSRIIVDRIPLRRRGVTPVRHDGRAPSCRSHLPRSPWIAAQPLVDCSRPLMPWTGARAGRCLLVPASSTILCANVSSSPSSGARYFLHRVGRPHSECWPAFHAEEIAPPFSIMSRTASSLGPHRGVWSRPSNRCRMPAPPPVFTSCWCRDL